MAGNGKLEAVTERKLVNGWASAPKVRIRQATMHDLEGIAAMAAVAGAPFEEPVREAILTGQAGAGLRVGVRSGHGAYVQYMAERFHHEGPSNPMVAYMDAALILLAENREVGVVGGMIAYPPVNVAEQVIMSMQRGGASDTDLERALLSCGMFFTRVKALAVAGPARGQGIGASLLKRCKQVYYHCRYEMIYGSMPNTPGLDQFYQRAGFTVREHGQPLDLSVQFGLPARISPGPGERIFLRART